MKILKLSSTLIAIGMVSCASVPDAAPGINPPEMDALVSSYYWEPGLSVPQYDRNTLGALIDRSINPDLDGERAEGHASSMILALASASDDFFASVLASRSKDVQKSARHFISSAWTYNKLHYPKTQAIYKNNEESEQGADGDADEAV